MLVSLILAACSGPPMVECPGGRAVGPDGLCPGVRHAGSPPVEDAVEDTAPDPTEDTADSGDPPPIAKTFTTHLPSTATGAEGLAVRVRLPRESQSRYADGAPVVVWVDGGWLEGDFGDGQAHDQDRDGFVRIDVLLPGGVAADGTRSGGELDRRGADSVRALQDVLAYAAGMLPDENGETLQDRVPHANSDVLGIVALSNGANLAIVAMAQMPSPLPPIDFLLAWESPIGDQFQAVELNDDPTYRPGSCQIASCPTEVGPLLAYDPAAVVSVKAMVEGEAVDLQGALFLDVDGDAAWSAADWTVPRILDADGAVAFPSVEMFLAVQRADPFDGAPPDWWPAGDALREFWSIRDATAHIAEVHARWPELLVMHAQSSLDHAQSQPDFPHARAHVNGWITVGHEFVRLNPDAAYLAAQTGASVDSLPDTPAGQSIPYPGTQSYMVPADAAARLVPAGLLELMDRTWTGTRTPDLHAVLVE